MLRAFATIFFFLVVEVKAGLDEPPQYFLFHLSSLISYFDSQLSTLPLAVALPSVRFVVVNHDHRRWLLVVDH